MYNNDIIPKVFLGIKTDVIEVDEIILNNTYSNSSLNFNNNNLIQKLQSRVRPIEGGLEISPYRDFSAGTLGGIVFDNETNLPCILSNSHCLDSRGKFSKGTPISQPSVGLSGGAYKRNIIGYFLKSIEIKTSSQTNPIYNIADCAIAELAPEIKYDTTILGIGEIRGSSDPFPNLLVKKVGRSTGLTEGYIKTINLSTGIKASRNASENTLFYKNLVRCDPIGSAGDSGSLVLDPLNRVVGLFSFSSNKYAYFTPIDIILNLLNISI
ncbi:hypothetical protein [Clostridium tarantellae]|uniref:Trypsin-like serine protease n=1 Tax=Clostridium tarantellae TaxID=39493 RepID=A0A6I1MRG0_9CLOT|nr:hypothetical protein [Clostridium tarantellae]MPQ44777.1 hypothetical protein [Clostridium tarantellae]